MFDVLVFASLPAIGIIIGSLLAECIHTPRWLIGASLHMTAGIAIALVSINIVPMVLETTPMWLIVTAFLIGACVSVMIVSLWGAFRVRNQTHSVGAWMVGLAVVTDLVSDGLMVGAGTAVGLQLGFLFAATQTIANIPGGFAITANFRDDGLSRVFRLGLPAFMLLPAIVSATIGYYGLRGAESVVHGAVLAVFVGILLLATVEDVIPQGDESQPPRLVSTLAFAIGFSGLALLSNVLG